MLVEISKKEAIDLLTSDSKENHEIIYFKLQNTYHRAIDYTWSFTKNNGLALNHTQFYKETNYTI